MNGKTVKKLLMKNRRRVFWGARAYLTVRLPVELLPGPLPKKPTIEGLKESEFCEGHWENEDLTEYVYIFKSQANREPEDGYFQELTHDGPTYRLWSYWKGERCVRDGSTERYEAVSEEIVGQYKVWHEWSRSLHRFGNGEVLDAFVEASSHAKVFSVWVRNGFVHLYYGVKWKYPNRKLAFSAALSRAVKLAAREGYRARVS